MPGRPNRSRVPVPDSYRAAVQHDKLLLKAHAGAVGSNDRAAATNGRGRRVRLNDRIGGDQGETAGPERPASERERAADERERAADERERAADEREWAENRRDRAADERDRIANERQAVADRRERIADDREKLADDREDAADERERQQDERDAPRTDRSKPPKAASIEARGRHALEAFERARARQAANAARTERNRALVERTLADQDRQRAAIAQEISVIGRGPRISSEPSGNTYRPLASRLHELRRQLIEAALATAEVEDNIASQQEDLAARRPTGKTKYDRAAQDAREGARRAREIAQRFGD